MKNTLYIIFVPGLIYLFSMFMMDEDSYNPMQKLSEPALKQLRTKPMAPLSFAPIKDTVYVLGDAYVEADLSKQRVHVHLRKGDVKTYKISSGNKNIAKGIETSSGLFTIQSKSRLAISKQFDDAELYNWMGFNYNIGFHGLKGNGYYWSLGVRPSSHGCVRMGREDGEQMYKLVRRGTPVLVHHGAPARVLAFATPKDMTHRHVIILGENGRQYSKLMERRLQNLYNGEAYTMNREKVFFDGTTVLKRNGFGEGNETEIPIKQRLPIGNLEEDNLLSADAVTIYTPRNLRVYKPKKKAAEADTLLKM